MFNKQDFQPLISLDEIKASLKETAEEINAYYQNQEVYVIGVLKGSIFLVCDLLRYLKIPTQLYFIQAQSYGVNGDKPGKLTVSGMDGLDITDKHLLLIDDILDTGNTLKEIANLLYQKKPASLKTLVLLTKNIQRTHAFKADWSLFNVENRFVVGYGMDYCELYRELPGIYTIAQL